MQQKKSKLPSFTYVNMFRALSLRKIFVDELKSNKNVKPDNVKVVRSFATQHTESETCAYVNKHPRGAIKQMVRGAY